MMQYFFKDEGVLHENTFALNENSFPITNITPQMIPYLQNRRNVIRRFPNHQTNAVFRYGIFHNNYCHYHFQLHNTLAYKNNNELFITKQNGISLLNRITGGSVQVNSETKIKSLDYSRETHQLVFSSESDFKIQDLQSNKIKRLELSLDDETMIGIVKFMKIKSQETIGVGGNFDNFYIIDQIKEKNLILKMLSNVNDFDFCDKSNQLFTAEDSQFLRMFDIRQQGLVRNFSQTESPNFGIQKISDNIFASIGEDQHLLFWDIRQETQPIDAMNLNCDIYSLKFNKEKKTFLIHGNFFSTLLIKLVDSVPNVHQIEFLSYIGGSCFSPDNNGFSISTYQGQIFYDLI